MIFRRQFSHFGASRSPLQFVEWVVASPNPMVSNRHDLPKQHQANLGVTSFYFWGGTTLFKQFFVNDFIYVLVANTSMLAVPLYPTHMVVSDIFDILISMISHYGRLHTIVSTRYRQCTHHIPTLHPHVAHHYWCMLLSMASNYWTDGFTSTWCFVHRSCCFNH